MILWLYLLMYGKSLHEDLFKQAAQREKARQAGFHGGIPPQGIFHDASLSGEYEVGKTQRKQYLNNSNSDVTLPAVLTAPILGVIAIGVLFFGIKFVSENIDIQPKAHFTHATKLDSEEEKQFANICTITKSTRLLSQPEATFLSSLTMVQESRTVGLLDHNMSNGFSKIVIKTDANPLQVLFGTQAEYKHGYIPTDNLGQCQAVESFDPQNAYLINSDIEPRHRRQNRNFTKKYFIKTEPIDTATLTREFCVVAQNGVNIRTEPTSWQGEMTIIAQLSFQSVVQTTGEKINNDWLQSSTTRNGQKVTGYIHSGYLGACPS